jgi:hypothetical protein
MNSKEGRRQNENSMMIRELPEAEDLDKVATSERALEEAIENFGSRQIFINGIRGNPRNSRGENKLSTPFNKKDS